MIQENIEGEFHRRVLWTSVGRESITYGLRDKHAGYQRRLRTRGSKLGSCAGSPLERGELFLVQLSGAARWARRVRRRAWLLPWCVRMEMLDGAISFRYGHVDGTCDSVK